MLKKMISLFMVGVIWISPAASLRAQSEKGDTVQDGTKRVRRQIGKRFLEQMQTRDRELGEAVQFLYSKGYRPLDDAILVASEDSDKPGRWKGKDVEVGIWRWEDDDPKTATGIMFYRAKGERNQKAEFSAFQIDEQGNTIWELALKRDKDGGKTRAFNDATGPKARKVAYQPVQFWAWSTYYSCAASGCGVTALGYFLFFGAGILGPQAFLTGCTFAMIGCAVVQAWNWW